MCIKEDNFKDAMRWWQQEYGEVLNIEEEEDHCTNSWRESILKIQWSWEIYLICCQLWANTIIMYFRNNEQISSTASTEVLVVKVIWKI